jgi:ATP-dependent Clp protease protease subunit
MNELYVRFFAPVVPQTAAQLLQVIDGALHDRTERLHIMLSSPGGSVFHGLSLYNFLRGLPVEVNTYNFGSVDSIGVVMYCAGTHRFSVPHARFLMHGVRFNVPGNSSFDEKQLEEQLKSVKIDQENIARVIADTAGKALHKVEEDMINRTTLNPSQAKDYGLVHEIKSSLFPMDARLAVIGEFFQGPPQLVVQTTAPVVDAYTQSRDVDVSTE